MPDLLNVESVMMCPHGGTVQAITSNTTTMAGGAPAVTATDTFMIAGCPFILGLVPHPCIMVQWVQPAMESTVSGNPTLTQASIGLCIAPDGAPQGTVIVAETQPQVAGL